MARPRRRAGDDPHASSSRLRLARCAPCAGARFSSATSLRSSSAASRAPELVGEHAPPHLLGLAGLEFEQLERPERDADEPVDLEAEVAEHAAHLAVLALAQADGDPRVGALHAIDAGLDRPVAHALDLDAVLQLVEVGLRARGRGRARGSGAASRSPAAPDGGPARRRW